MSDEAALLRAIAESPEDDSLRLVYADWLDDDGQADRAEFVRLQCRLARLSEVDPQRPALAAREKDLLAQHLDEWVAPLRKLGTSGEWFQRGVVYSAGTYAAKFLANAEELFRLAPTLCDLRIGQVAKHRVELGSSPHLARLTGLSIYEPARPGFRLPGALALAASPHPVNLRSLWLDSCLITDAGITALSSAPFFRRLRSLNVGGLHGNRITPVGAAAMAAGPPMNELTYLDLSNNTIHNDGAVALFSGPLVPRLRQLNLTSAGVGGDAINVLASSPSLTELETLNLSRNWPSAAGFVALARSPNLRRLHDLDLSWTRMGDAGIEGLAGAPLLERLTNLNLTNTDSSDATIRALTAPPGAPWLESLSLFGNLAITDDGAVALAECPHLPRLRQLWLTGTNVTRRGVEALVRSPDLKALRELEIVAYNEDAEDWDVTVYESLLDELKRR
jgi:uncharacterized protein (TIGR02996 family)